MTISLATASSGTTVCRRVEDTRLWEETERQREINASLSPRSQAPTQSPISPALIAMAPERGSGTSPAVTSCSRDFRGQNPSSRSTRCSTGVGVVTRDMGGA